MPSFVYRDPQQIAAPYGLDADQRRRIEAALRLEQAVAEIEGRPLVVLLSSRGVWQYEERAVKRWIADARQAQRGGTVLPRRTQDEERRIIAAIGTEFRRGRAPEVEIS